MEDTPARIVIGRGPSPQKEYTLNQTETTIGRSASNKIALPDPEVSRRHARIVRESGRYYVEDWGSTNGTFVNGQRLTGRMRLNDGDRIALGDAVVMIFHDAAAEEMPTVLTPPVREEPWEAEPAEPLPAAEAEEEEAWVAEWVYPPSSEPETAVPASRRPEPAPPPSYPEITPPDTIGPPSARRRLLTCGCIVLLLLFLCAATLFFLDAYQQGRLLYCGPLRPFFEIALGPFGFAPACP